MTTTRTDSTVPAAVRPVQRDDGHTMRNPVFKRPLCFLASLARPAGRRLASLASASEPESRSSLDCFPATAADKLPRNWVLFTDLHVQHSTLELCLEVLRRVAREASARGAGIICLGDFWHAGGTLHTRQLNLVLDELRKWRDIPVLMIPGNHDQAMRGNPHPLLHALTPLQLALGPAMHVFSRPTLLRDSLWLPYGTSAAELAAASGEAGALRHGAPLGAVFCHADIVGASMNDGVAAVAGLLAVFFSRYVGACRR